MKPRPPITRTKVGSAVEDSTSSPCPPATLRGGASSRSDVSGVLRGELVSGEPSEGEESVVDGCEGE